MENLSRDTAARLNTRYFTILNHFFALSNTLSTSDTRNLASTSATKTENALWVDRYRPQRFIELVGDDRVHREVMAWVKEWDWCVFVSIRGSSKPRLSDEKRGLDGSVDDPTERLRCPFQPVVEGGKAISHNVAIASTLVQV